MFYLRQRQQELQLELKALQAALILHPRPGESQTADNLVTYAPCLQFFLENRAERSYLEAQLAYDLDTALDCLRSHIQSGTSLPNSNSNRGNRS